jgi:hypothetical protein
MRHGGIVAGACTTAGAQSHVYEPAKLHMTLSAPAIRKYLVLESAAAGGAFLEREGAQP